MIVSDLSVDLPMTHSRCNDVSSRLHPDLLAVSGVGIADNLARGLPRTVITTSSPDSANATNALSFAFDSFRVIIM